MITATTSERNAFEDPASGRAWPTPSRRPAIGMVWHDLLFMHWPVPIEALRNHIPRSLEIDTYGGEAWLGVVPFYMSDVGPLHCPKPAWLANFPELNVRTYVTINDKPGVWFFSLDAHQRIAVWMARLLFHLPYRYARMKYERNAAETRIRCERADRRASAAGFAGEYQPVGEIAVPQPGTLEDWLVSRYCLYAANRRGRIYRGEIDHAPWPLQSAEANVTENTMTEPLGIRLPATQPLLHYASRLDVVAWTLDAVT